MAVSTWIRGFAIFAVMVQLFPQNVFAATEAQQIWKRARTKLESKSDQAHVALTILEANGEKKSREMDLQLLRTKTGFKSMIRMTAPADFKRTAMLAEINNGADREWLYVPATKQVRRIASTKKSAGVLGSELCPEDLDPMALKQAKVEMIKKTDTEAVIALIPAAGASEYSRVLTTFRVADGLPIHTEYFKGTKLEKTIDFLDYKTVEGGVVRAQKIHIMNVTKRRGTDLEFSDMKANVSLLDKDFTPEALKEN